MKHKIAADEAYDIPAGATTTDLPPGVLYKVIFTFNFTFDINSLTCQIQLKLMFINLFYISIDFRFEPLMIMSLKIQMNWRLKLAKLFMSLNMKIQKNVRKDG